MKNFISVEHHSREELTELLQLTKYIKSHPKEFRSALNGKIIASMFFEPSTRTNLSFQTAILRLGGQIIGFSGAEGTSVKKGESLTDTIHMASAYADAIILRHNARGSSHLAVEVSPDHIPVISAGEGSQSHPTQALLDMFTILETQKKLTEIEIGMTGDLRYSRTIPSLLKFLGIIGKNKVYLFAHPLLQLSQSFRENLLSRYPDLLITEATSLEENIENLDVLYFTRIQRERFADPDLYEDVHGAFIFKKEFLNKVRRNFILLHPLPRVDEIPYDIDKSKTHAKYFQQAENGVYARMALLLTLLAPEKVKNYELIDDS
ncbi:MAG: aspartate carbamoyltransferase [Candidatus Hodarchaeales archaeon]|jgi:aspartate carbamoyltransferase catalytic subunit